MQLKPFSPQDNSKLRRSGRERLLTSIPKAQSVYHGKAHPKVGEQQQQQWGSAEDSHQQ